jgi:hypothetical protein
MQSQMAKLLSTTQLVSLRDKLFEAYSSLAGEGVSSYSIGDQTFTLRDLDSLWRQIQNLERQIAMKDRTLGGGGRNRITLRNFNG